MKYWITTDTHLSHYRMIEFGRPNDFEDRIFKSFSPLERNDVLIHLGDVCIGRDDYNHKRLLDAIPCKKWLIRGNHDRKSNSWYMSRGWDFMGDRIVLRYGGKNILFSHTPLAFDENIDLNIHGHLHDNTHRDSDFDKVRTDKHILIALEKNNYQLTLLDSLLNKAQTKT